MDACRRYGVQAVHKENTPRRVIGLKLDRYEDAMCAKTGENNVSPKPTKQSLYNWRKP